MFYQAAEFPFIKEFEKHYEAIRQEFLGLDPRVLNIHRNGPHEQYVAALIDNNGWTPSWQVKSKQPNEGWLTYGLSFRGFFPKEAETKFPLTMNLLSRLQGLRVCAFSRMAPLSFIAPHRHPELGRGLLTFHLGIDVAPGKSFLFVDGIPSEEGNAKSMVFDGSHEHFAVNMSSSDRTILYMEFDSNEAKLI